MSLLEVVERSAAGAPVQTEGDVIARITAAVAAARASGRNAVYAANYDAARLGHSAECPGPSTNIGYQCPNLEDGNARKYLDAIASDIPIFVTAESGHINYANTPALAALNICGTDVATPPPVLRPRPNPLQEEALAQAGQPDEDLSFVSLGYFEGQILKADPVSVVADIARGVSL